MKLLLISNSTNYGESYLSWPQDYISDFLKRNQIKKVHFVPYAGVTVDFDQYEAKVAEVFSKLGFELISLHRFADPVAELRNAECVAVGGGNTFNLVYWLHKTGLMQAIREKVVNGMPYMGWSAGSNVACPSLKTTNDMPVIEPESFECMNLVPFQINPHYLDANPEGHGGETREQRIMEFLEINKTIKVAGLREASLLEIENGKIHLKGKNSLRVFQYGIEPMEVEPGHNLSFLR